MERVNVRLATTCVLLLIAMAVAPKGGAQNAEAPHPSPEAAKLWAHGTGSNEFVGFMNTLEKDGGDDALGSGSLINSAVTWKLTLNPALVAALVLDASKTIDITAYVGASQGVGRVTVTTKITHGAAVVAEGAGVGLTITPATAAADGKYAIVSWKLPPKASRLESGSDLVWSVTATGTATNIFLGIGDSRGRSHLVLPIAAVEMATAVLEIPVTYRNVTDPVLSESSTISNATTQRTVLNWTTNATDVASVLSANATGGAFNYSAVDASGSEIFSARVEAREGNASGPGGETVRHRMNETAPGGWTITIDLENFTGDFQLVLGPSELVVEEAPQREANAASGNVTDDEAADVQEKGGLLPGPSVVSLIGAVGVAFTVMCRRRI